MNFGSLFSGIGGLDLGLERAGMECKWQVEIDDYATRVLERHSPNVQRWRDVWDFIADAECVTRRQTNPLRNTERNEGKGQALAGQSFGSSFGVDLVCGGFPCQPVSLAGRRIGDRDERWLWPAFREVVRIIRPRWVLLENVRGLLSADSGRLFGGILGDLAALGFDAEWQVLPAAAFGAPHLRERVFVVAYAQGQRQRRGARDLSGEDGRSHSKLPFKLDCPSQIITDTSGTRREEWKPRATDARTGPEFIGGEWRSVEPTICRGDHGTANRVDRLRGLGNAVVPAVGEFIGRQIMEKYRHKL